MYRYLTGSESPPPKKPKNEKKPDTIDKQNPPSRTFKPSWLNTFDWLVFEEGLKGDGGSMFCKICRTKESSGTFVSGCKNFKIETIKYHNQSESHKHRVQKEKAKSDIPGTSVAEQMLAKLHGSNYLILGKLFRNAHAIAKQGRPYTDFTWLCNLDQAKGVEIGKTYRNDKQVPNFIHYIAEAQRKKNFANYESIRFISPISDGSTDTSFTEAEILYIRHCHKGVIGTDFVGIRNIGKANAENITGVVCNMLDDNLGKTWRNKIVGMATDGASVMLGSTNGVIARMRREVDRPYIQAIHCSAHRLELAYRDATKSLELFQKVDNLLMSIYLFYRNSPLNRANLKESFKSLDTTILIPSRVGGTRWLPHVRRALEHILVGYEPIMQHLTQIQNPADPAHRKDSAAKARNYIKLLSQMDFVYYMFFMWDIVNVLSKVSETFQERSSTIAEVYEELTTSKCLLEKYKHSDGPKLKVIVGKDQYKGQELKGSLASFTSTRGKMIAGLLKSLTDRFEVDSELMKAACVVQLQTWPEKLSEEHDFGDASVVILTEKFSPAMEAAGIDAAEVEPEWTRLKYLMYNRRMGDSCIVRCVKVSGNDDTKLILQDTFLTLQQEQLNPVWFPEDECLHVKKEEKNTTYVFEVFEGDAFEHIQSLGCRIFGPLCITVSLACMKDIPRRSVPIYNLAMKDVVICCSSISNDVVRDELYKKVQWMGGEYQRDFTAKVTHLIVGEVGSKKYQVAAGLGKHIMLPDWVLKVWDKARLKPVHGLDELFQQYKCPVFMGRVMTVSGLSSDERREVKKLVEKEGGTYSGELRVKECTHLIINDAKGQKYQFALKWQIHVVRPEWLYDSIEKGYCRDEAQYPVSGDADTRRGEMKTSTPERHSLAISMAAARPQPTAPPAGLECPTPDNMRVIVRDHEHLADTVQQQQVLLLTKQQNTAEAWTRNKQEIETKFSELHELLVRREADILLNIDETYEDEEKGITESLTDTAKDIAAVNTQLETLAEIESWDSRTDDYRLAVDAISETFVNLLCNTNVRDEVAKREIQPCVVLNSNVKSVLEDALFVTDVVSSADANIETEDGTDAASDESETDNTFSVYGIGRLDSDSGVNEVCDPVSESTGGVLVGAYGGPDTTSPPSTLEPVADEDDPPPYWQAIGLSGPLPDHDTHDIDHLHSYDTRRASSVPVNSLISWHSFPFTRPGDVRQPQAVALLWYHDRICVADSANNRLKFLSSSGEKITDMTLPGDIYDVAFIDDDVNNTMYVLTIPRTNVIMFLSLVGGYSIKVTRKLNLRQHYTAISKGPREGTLVGADGAPTANTKARVDIFNYSGKIGRSLTHTPTGQPFSRPKSVEVFMNRIIVSDSDLNLVAVYLGDGSAVGEYSGTPTFPLAVPTDLTLDHNGNVMILDSESGNIHVIDLQCRNLQIIKVPKGNSSGGTRLLAFDRATKRLAIARRSPRDVAVFTFDLPYESPEQSYSEQRRNLMSEGPTVLPPVEGMLPSTIERIGSGRQRPRYVFNL